MKQKKRGETLNDRRVGKVKRLKYNSITTTEANIASDDSIISADYKVKLSLEQMVSQRLSRERESIGTLASYPRNKFFFLKTFLLGALLWKIVFRFPFLPPPPSR